MKGFFFMKNANLNLGKTYVHVADSDVVVNVLFIRELSIRERERRRVRVCLLGHNPHA